MLQGEFQEHITTKVEEFVDRNRLDSVKMLFFITACEPEAEFRKWAAAERKCLDVYIK